MSMLPFLLLPRLLLLLPLSLHLHHTDPHRCQRSSMSTGFAARRRRIPLSLVCVELPYPQMSSAAHLRPSNGQPYTDRKRAARRRPLPDRAKFYQAKIVAALNFSPEVARRDQPDLRVVRHHLYQHHSLCSTRRTVRPQAAPVLVLLWMNLVCVIDDIHVGRFYEVQLVVAVALAAVVIYMFMYNRRKT